MTYNLQILCIECSTDCERCGKIANTVSTNNKKNAIKWLRGDGWFISNKGYSICPECRKKYGDERP